MTGDQMVSLIWQLGHAGKGADVFAKPPYRESDVHALWGRGKALLFVWIQDSYLSAVPPPPNPIPGPTPILELSLSPIQCLRVTVHPFQSSRFPHWSCESACE